MLPGGIRYYTERKDQTREKQSSFVVDKKRTISVGHGERLPVQLIKAGKS